MAAGALLTEKVAAPPPGKLMDSEHDKPPSKTNDSENSHKVWLSVLACVSYFSIGGMMGLLGPAIPALADSLDVGATAMGGVFATRAVGYILGSLSVGWFGSWPVATLVTIMATAGFTAALINALIPHLGRLWLVMGLCLIQGVGLSIISTVGNIVLLQLWRKKSGVWLQCLHSAFGLGAVASPLVLGWSGLNPSFFAIAGVGMLPMLGLVMELASQTSKKRPPSNNKAVGERESSTGTNPNTNTKGGWLDCLRLYKTRTRSNSRSSKGNGNGKGAWLGLGLGGLRRANSQQFPLTSAQGDEAGIVMTPNDVQLLQRERSLDHSELGQEEQGSNSSSSSSSSRPNSNAYPYPSPSAPAHQHQHRSGQRVEGGYPNTHANGNGNGNGCGDYDYEGCEEGSKETQSQHTHKHHSSGTQDSYNEQEDRRGEGEGQGLPHDPNPPHGMGHGVIEEGAWAHNRFASNTSDITLFTFSSNNNQGLPPIMPLYHPHPHNAHANLGVPALGGAPCGAAADASLHGGSAYCASHYEASGVGGRSVVGSVYSATGHPLVPLPLAIRLLLTLFFGFYVGAEVGFGGWVASYVLLEGTMTSQSHAAFLVAIFWACITGGRVVAVVQALYVSPGASLRWQLFLSLGGALLFFVAGSSSATMAAASAVAYGYGMSSIYPMTMAWPASAGLMLEPKSTTQLVIGGCVGEALVPVIIGELMRVAGPSALPWSILVLVVALVAIQIAVPLLAHRAASDYHHHGGGGCHVARREDVEDGIGAPVDETVTSSHALALALAHQDEASCRGRGRGSPQLLVVDTQDGASTFEGTGSVCQDYSSASAHATPSHLSHSQLGLGQHRPGAAPTDIVSLDGVSVRSVISAVSVMSPGNFYTIPTWQMPE